MECFQFQMADTKSAIHISGRGATTGNKIQSVENIKSQSSIIEKWCWWVGLVLLTIGTT